MPCDEEPIEGFKYSCVKPGIGEVAELYATITESADKRDIEEEFFPSNTPPNNTQNNTEEIFVVCRDSQKKLIGVLRGWKWGNGRGIIENVAVHGKYQNRNIARKLVGKAQKEYNNVQWIGHPYRLADKLDKDLNLIRNLYGISLTLAFQQTVTAAYRLIFERHAEFSGRGFLLLILLAAGLSTIGCRFFFGAGNIRRFFLRQVFNLQKTPVRSVILFHLPILFGHAVLYFFLCELYANIVDNGITIRPLLFMAGTLTILLWLNSGWLFSLAAEGHHWPECIWIPNNAVCGVVLCLITVVAFCYASALWLLFVITFMMLVNSYIDLHLTNRAYLLGDASSGG